MIKSDLELNKSRKIINIILFIVFILFAVVQLNDPDPFIWFSIYITVAAISLVANYKVIPKLLIYLLSFGIILYATKHFSYFSEWLEVNNKKELLGKMVYKKPYLEGTREFLGLLMAAAAILIQLNQPNLKGQ